MKISTEDDFDKDALKGRQIAVLGYGSQGRAHALNLRDSGYDIVLGLREKGPSWAKATDDGWKPLSMEAAAKSSQLIAFLTPDMSQPDLYQQFVEPHLEANDMLLFAHGFSVHYGRIHLPSFVDVALIAPKGPGDLVRREYELGRGVPCLRAVHQDCSGKAGARALAYAHGLGGTRAGVLDTTFKEETETDLFGEQAVLCGGATELVVQGFETLVEAGYQPEVAYFECLHELKLIVDLLHEGGMKKMLEFISETAAYGDFKSGPRIINEETRSRMRDVLRDIQNGNFARDWILENQAGLPGYNAALQADLDHPLEKVGKDLRARMPWLDEGDGKKN